MENEIPKSVAEELVSIVGSDFLFTDKEHREKYSRSTLSSGTLPVGIIKPKNKNEVQLVMKVAGQHGLSIHPISTGKNWGYSDACAPGEKNLILDLGRMNSILEVNEDLCYVTLEPGVTQGQLFKFISDNNYNLWMDATGAGPDTSIIGNVMERGFGHSPYGDRYANSCAYEIILPDGEVLNTGFGHYKSSKVSEVYKWGVGPSVDGLFTQSNLGVVTKMTIWLMRKPEDFRVMFFMLNKEEDIVDLIENFRDIKIDGTLKSTVHISNDLRVFSTLQRFPFEEVSSTSISQEKRKGLRNKYGLGFWVGSAGFYGSRKQNMADIQKVKRQLKKVSGVKASFVVGSFQMSVLDKLVSFLVYYKFGDLFINFYKKLKVSFELLQGKTPSSNSFSGLWKVKEESGVGKTNTNNPLDHNAGFYWISPLLPMRGEDVAKLNTLVEPVFSRYGFDFMQTLSMVSERSLCSVLTIYFDKNDKQEIVKAEDCHNEVVQLLIKNGYILYRSGNQSMKYLDQESDVFFDFLKKIKKAIDPTNTISPGKYIKDL